MTEKDKIVEIIAKNGVYNGKSLSFDYYVIQPEELADALIKAGYGDVKEWKERAGKHRVLVLPDGTIKQSYSNEEVEEIARQRDEYKHRAEVAERALATVCEEVLHARYPVEYVTVSVVEDFIQLTLKDAEKELAEEE